MSVRTCSGHSHNPEGLGERGRERWLRQGPPGTPFSLLHPGEVSGQALIDIGSGPTIYQLLSACAHFEDITMTDFLEVNRQELGLWLREEPGAFDWSVYSQHACLIEGKG